MKVKLKPSTQLSCGVSQDKEYSVLEENEKYYAIWNNNGYRVCLNKRYFDIIEEAQSEPNITKLDELKQHCKNEIQKEQESVYQYETIIIARKQVIKTYESILERLEQ